MKRLTCASLAALLFAAAGSAQAQQLHFGVRGGLNVAGAETEGALFTEDTGTRSGYHFGVLGMVDISSWFSLQTEVWYSQKGFAKGNGDIALDLTYFEIPVLAVVKLPIPLRPRIYAGPVLGLESGCTVISGEEKTDCEEVGVGLPRTKGADSGLIFGGGITLDFGPGLLLGDVMYNHGLTDISEPSDVVDSIKTRTWYFSAGYAFALGG